jgi:Na+/H+ antiporter NhaA
LWSTDVEVGFGGSRLSLDLREWVNDGLMALFFFVVGLEIRREFDMGELRERRRIATPVAAAIGGMTVPALIYLAFNLGEPAARGWGVPIGTDTAFALGVLTLVGGAFAGRLRPFLLTLAIVDDIIALLVIALVYTSDLSIRALVVAVLLFGLVLLMRRAGVRHGVAYFVVGLGLWIATLTSGVHATIAGVAMGLLATAAPPSRERLERASALWRLFREEPTPQYARTASRSVALTISPNERLQYLFHPWTSYVIVPLFALANAGIRIDAGTLRDAATSPITLGIVFGLVLGKPIGIAAAAWLVSRRGLGGFPLSLPWPPLLGAATIAGIGFTVSLLIADISFEGRALEDAKLGILAASATASILSWATFRIIERLPRRALLAGRERVAPPIEDLMDPVDLDVDHVRGPEDAPVTLVEYGDFECPHCGRAEPIGRAGLRRPRRIRARSRAGRRPVLRRPSEPPPRASRIARRPERRSERRGRDADILRERHAPLRRIQRGDAQRTGAANPPSRAREAGLMATFWKGRAEPMPHRISFLHAPQPRPRSCASSGRRLHLAPWKRSRPRLASRLHRLGAVEFCCGSGVQGRGLVFRQVDTGT